MEKRIALCNGKQIFDLTIRPGTTGRDVLRTAGLPQDFQLSVGNGLLIQSEENVYAAVEDGDKLHASSRADVG